MGSKRTEGILALGKKKLLKCSGLQKNLKMIPCLVSSLKFEKFLQSPLIVTRTDHSGHYTPVRVILLKLIQSPGRRIKNPQSPRQGQYVDEESATASIF